MTIKSKPASKEYRENYDRIFGKKTPDTGKERRIGFKEGDTVTIEGDSQEYVLEKEIVGQ